MGRGSAWALLSYSRRDRPLQPDHDPRLARLAEIVREADLRKSKYPRDESRGVDVAIGATLAASPADQQVLAHGMTLFEGLHATTGKKD